MKKNKNKVMKYKGLIMFCLVLFQFEMVYSQVYERSRTETRSFKVYKETTLEISSKYGNIHLFTWEKDSVKINIDVHVKANKEAKADKIFEYIDFEFSSTKYYIIANTELQNTGSFWSEVSDLANTIFSGSNKAQIDYNVYLPANMEIKLVNKFGNIYMTNQLGKTTIDLSNGDLKANDFKGYTDISLNFGNASINSIDIGKLTMGYAELTLTSANQLDIESKSSTINIRDIGQLTFDSRRDKYFIDKLTSIKGSTSFSYLTIKDFSNNMTISSDYGEIKLEGINTAFKLIDLKSNYTDIYLSLPAAISFQLNVDHTEATGISYPEHYKKVKVEAIDKKEDIYRTSGLIGEQAKAKAKIGILLKSGKLVISDVTKGS